MSRLAVPPPPIASPPPPVPPTPAKTAGARPPTQGGGTSHVALAPIPNGGGHRTVLYGPGGIGKTTLAAASPGPVVFFDLDDSLPRLRQRLAGLPTPPELRVVPARDSWEDIRRALRSPGWDGVGTIVIDSATRAEELAVEHTLANVPHEKGQRVKRVEDYGFGKGYTHVFDTFRQLLPDLDLHVRAGRHVVLICHDCTANVPNPNGEDWIRFEPRLQSPNSGKSSIRLRVREWADHVLFVGYDVAVADGKARGGETRTIYPNERPHCMAKSRTLTAERPLAGFDTAFWADLLGTR